MPPVVSWTLLSLEENPREIYLEVTSVLLRLANNVIKNPSDPKYRSIRLANPTVANKLLPAVGAMECLFEMGFKEAEDCLVLPENANLESIKALYLQILARRESFTQSAPDSSSSSVSKSAATSQAKRTVPSQPVKGSSQNVSKVLPSTSAMREPVSSPTTTSNTTVHQATKSSQFNRDSKKYFKPGFLERIVSASESMAEDHHKERLELAKKYIPLTELEIAAVEQLRNIQKLLKKDQAEKKETSVIEPSMQELILVQLLSWFKEKFFNWINDPPCDSCSGKTKFRRTDTRGFIRIEVYECAVCFKETEFPRHTDPLKLLQTRRGRCGEWGRCFTFLCLALGWDARLVIDETDHVWTEVYVVSQSRWVHCDPCENAFDTPLMYELGWKKKLSYILAFAPDDVQDVTWRYSTNHKAILNRRKYCTEAQLLETIMIQRKLRQQNLHNARKTVLLKRTLLELVELWKEPSEKDGIYKGRQSGSLAWRLSRGETSGEAVNEPYIWKPTESEIKKKKMQIQYLPGLDQYQRGPESSEGAISGWQNGVNAVKGVFRKEEKDWNMVYLSREEGGKTGQVIWSVNLNESGMVVDTIQLVFCSQVYESGQVNAVVCGADCCVKVPTDQPEVSISTSALSGATSIKLSVDLSGGNGDVAWQHAQLFRTERGSNQVGFDLVIKLKAAPIMPITQ